MSASPNGNNLAVVFLSSIFRILATSWHHWVAPVLLRGGQLMALANRMIDSSLGKECQPRRTGNYRLVHVDHFDNFIPT